MKKTGKIILSLLIAFILTANTLSVTVFAVEAETTDEYPSSFDLRSVDTDGDGVGDRCYVTSVKAQQPFGVCWSFASIAACEISLLGSVYADDPDAYKTLNLSEKQVAYFSHWYIDDPTHPQYGEGMRSFEYKNAGDIYGGGSAFLAANTFAAGIGPVSESRDEVYEFHGKNRETMEMQSASGKVTCYSNEDDWSMDDSCRYQRDYILKESYLLESPAQFDIDFKTGKNDYIYSEAATNAMKEQLMQKRGVVIGFHADTSLPWQTGGEGEYMNAQTWAHYTWNTPMANHAVTIVGWDDNYSADNFVSAHRPPANGAWLVKNSWGAGTNEFPNAGTGQWGIPVQKTDANGDPVYDENGDPVTVGSGYFWLSYYDRTIINPQVFVFDTQWHSSAFEDEAMDSIHLDQHDMMPVGSINSYSFASETKSANVFTPEDGEHVVFVSYQTKSPNTTVSYEVYLLAPGYTSPTDGVLMASGEHTYALGGFYMDELTPYLTVSKGQSYSIVVTQKNNDGMYVVNTPYNNGKDAPKPPAEIAEFATPQYAVAVVNEGESLLYMDGEWLDWSKQATQEKLVGPVYAYLKEMDPQFDNFPIKGFAIDKVINGSLRLADGVESLNMTQGESTTVKLELYGADDGIDLGDLTVEWDAAPGAEAIIGVALSDGGQEAAITALKPGKTYLKASAEGAGAVIIPIEIKAIRRLGDANRDGVVDITDAAAIQRKLASVTVPVFDETVADVDGDGKVTILDATYIQRHLAHIGIPYEIGKTIA